MHTWILRILITLSLKHLVQVPCRLGRVVLMVQSADLSGSFWEVSHPGADVSSQDSLTFSWR